MKTPPPPRLAWLRRAHPLVFAVAPLLTLFASNRTQVPATDLLRPTLLVVALAALLWPAARRLARGDADRAALALSAALFVFWGYGAILYAYAAVGATVPALLAGGSATGPAPEDPETSVATWSPARVFLLPIALLGLLVAVRLPLRARQDWTPVAWIAAAVLLLPPIGSLASSIARPAPAPAASVGGAAKARSDVPDLYLIVLDGYGRADMLREKYGLDNRPFVEALEARGFTVAPRSRSNYNVTTLSLGAVMGLDYLTPGPGSGGDAHAAMDRGALPTLLRSHGLRYVSVPTGYEATAPASADVVLDATMPRGPAGALLQAPFPTPFEALLLDRTPLGAIRRRDTLQYDRHRRRLLGALEHLAEADDAAPGAKFVFGHVLAPHPPFVIGPRGEAVYPPRPFGIADGADLHEEPAAYRSGYSGQLTGLNARVLAALDALRARSSRPAVIVLMGDHGPKCETDLRRPERTNLRESFSNLLAVSLPEGTTRANNAARSRLLSALREETVTPINALRLVCGAYYGADLPRLSERSLFPDPAKPGEYRDVTAALDALEVGAARVAAAEVPARPAQKQ